MSHLHRGGSLKSRKNQTELLDHPYSDTNYNVLTNVRHQLQFDVHEPPKHFLDHYCPDAI
jgi:hypothetical protein